MNKNEFLMLFRSEMDDDDIALPNYSEQTKLSEFNNWDSLSRAMVYNFVDREMRVKLNHADLKVCKTIGDIMLLLGLDE